MGTTENSLCRVSEYTKLAAYSVGHVNQQRCFPAILLASLITCMYIYDEMCRLLIEFYSLCPWWCAAPCCPQLRTIAYILIGVYATYVVYLHLFTIWYGISRNLISGIKLEHMSINCNQKFPSSSICIHAASFHSI